MLTSLASAGVGLCIEAGNAFLKSGRLLKCPPQSTRDGLWVFYCTADGEGWALSKVNLESAEGTRVTGGQIWPLGFTSDGKQLLALSLSSRTEPSHAVILSPDTGAELEPVALPAFAWKAADAGVLPRLTPDGASVSYVDVRDGAENIWVQPLHEGAVRKVTDFRNQHIFGFAWSQSGDLGRGARYADRERGLDAEPALTNQSVIVPRLFGSATRSSPARSQLLENCSADNWIETSARNRLVVGIVGPAVPPAPICARTHEDRASARKYHIC